MYRVPLANVDLGAANLTEVQTRVEIAQRLIQSGFEPSAVLSAVGLDPITHTGVPSTQLQAIAQINPDEPTAALDRQSGRNVVEIMQKLAKEQGCTILLVTHDNRIFDIADRIVNMEDGRLGD